MGIAIPTIPFVILVYLMTSCAVTKLVAMIFNYSYDKALAQVLIIEDRCVSCGYDLSNGKVNECPECGRTRVEDKRTSNQSVTPPDG